MSEPRIATLTIANGATTSNTLNMRGANTLRAWYGTLFGPATLPETVLFQIADSAGNWKTLESPPGTDVSVTGNDSAIAVGPFVASQVRLSCAAGVGAERIFTWEAVAAR